jgi:hypothetical protein
VAGEIRQAVQRGEALVMDGIHDERNRPLDDVIGIKFVGKYNETDLPIKAGSERIPAATLGTRGVSLRLQLAGGEIDAVYSAHPSRPAMITRDYGDGAAVLFTFDWVGTLTALGNEWKPTAAAAFDWVSPLPSARIAEDALTALRFTVANVGAAGPVNARLTLPAGFTFVEAQPAASVGSDSVSWSFGLATGANQEITAWVRAPNVGGSYDLTLTATSGTNGSTASFTGTATLLVIDLAQLADEAVAAILALAPTTANDRQARDRALAGVQSAVSQSASGQHLSAIAVLVDAEVELRRISTADVEAALIATARLQQVIERRAGE